jgi:hypothetical protein
MGAFAIHAGRRTVEMTVEGQTLRIINESPFRRQVRTWSRAEITAIRADISNAEGRHQGPRELQIHPVSGKKWGILAGWNEEELLWVATQLRQALRVPALNDGNGAGVPG